jgi:hypothetical protein
MRSLLLCSLALLVAGILVVACNYADPSQCFPNTGNGFGGAGTLPIGAGVGVGSGDMARSPPFHPLGYGAQANPCNTPSGDTPSAGAPAAGTSGAGGASGDTANAGGSGGAGLTALTEPSDGGVEYAWGSDGAVPSDSDAAAPTMGWVIRDFKPANFAFVTTLPDDGEGLAGGYQESNTILTLTDGVSNVYSCRIHIGMPLRTVVYGKVPPAAAAIYSANAANAAAAALWPTPFTETIFCLKFKPQIGAEFNVQYRGLGATMMQ